MICTLDANAMALVLHLQRRASRSRTVCLTSKMMFYVWKLLTGMVSRWWRKEVAC